MTVEDEHLLTPEQRQRSEAATRAGIILSSRPNPFQIKTADHSDIVHLAHYILTGKHFILDLDLSEDDTTDLYGDGQLVRREKEAREAELKRRADEEANKEEAIPDDLKPGGTVDQPYVPVTPQRAYKIRSYNVGAGEYEPWDVRFPCCQMETVTDLTSQQADSLIETHDCADHQ